VIDSLGGTQVQGLEYDALDRLTSARVGDVNCNNAVGYGEYADESYTYDATTGNLASKTGLGSYSYGDTAHKHAVTATGSGWAYQYDADGNMTRRDPPGSDVYDYAYDPENRLHQVEKNEVGQAEFTYDGEGARVQAEVNSTVTYFSGGIYESTGGVITKYYTASGVRLALRVGGDLTYLFGDHLGSTSATYRVSDTVTVRQLYKPWGEPRYASSSLPTPYTYTGQYHYLDDLSTPATTEGFGLMFYNARWYDPGLRRSLQPQFSGDPAHRQDHVIDVFPKLYPKIHRRLGDLLTIGAGCKGPIFPFLLHRGGCQVGQ
jgi:YD repeat-containing protein